MKDKPHHPSFFELPKRTETQIIGRQFLRSGTSVGDRRTLAISHKKGRRDFLQRASPLAWTKKIARFHFDVLRILKTCKFPGRDDHGVFSYKHAHGSFPSTITSLFRRARFFPATSTVVLLSRLRTTLFF